MTSRKTARDDEVARLPLNRKSPVEPKLDFLEKEDAIALLERSGISLSPGLANSLRIPQYLYQGKYERLEFFDTSSHPQPFPYHDSDSPAACMRQGKEVPSWIKQWYLGIVDEGGQRFILLVQAGRSVFLKCALTDAEALLPFMIRDQAMKAGGT